MRILWLSPYLPFPIFGGGTRVYNLIKALAPTCAIDLMACAEVEEPDDEVLIELRSLCRSVEVVPSPMSSRARRRHVQLRALVSRRASQYWMFYSPHVQARIDQALCAVQYDVVILEHSFMGYYVANGRAPIVLDQHNVESEILRRSGRRERSMMRRAYNLLEYVKYRPDEQRICQAADLILAASESDQKTMGKWASPPIVVVPNGVDSAYFAPEDGACEAEQHANLVFTGSMHYAPNTEAMLYFAAEIWPLIRAKVPNVTLKIVGGDPPPEILRLGRLPGVVVTGYVPDVRPYLAEAQVVVAPLRIGGGTRLKIVEALAMGRAVVSTPIGCEGLDVQDGRHLLVANQPAEFATQVIELLSDPARREALGREGRHLVGERYDWQAIGSRLETSLRELVERTGSRLGPVTVMEPTVPANRPLKG